MISSHLERFGAAVMSTRAAYVSQGMEAKVL